MKIRVSIAVLLISSLIYGLSIIDDNPGPVLCSITGNVLDMETQEGVSVRVEAFDKDKHRVFYGRSSAEENGRYRVPRLLPAQEYKIKLTDIERYGVTEFSVGIPETSEALEVKKDFHIRKLSSLREPRP